MVSVVKIRCCLLTLCAAMSMLESIVEHLLIQAVWLTEIIIYYFIVPTADLIDYIHQTTYGWVVLVLFAVTAIVSVVDAVDSLLIGKNFFMLRLFVAA